MTDELRRQGVRVLEDASSDAFVKEGHKVKVCVMYRKSLKSSRKGDIFHSVDLPF